MRPLRIRLLDNSVKTVKVDQSLPVEKLMPVICERIGRFLLYHNVGIR